MAKGKAALAVLALTAAAAGGFAGGKKISTAEIAALRATLDRVHTNLTAQAEDHEAEANRFLRHFKEGEQMMPEEITQAHQTLYGMRIVGTALRQINPRRASKLAKTTQDLREQLRRFPRPTTKYVHLGER